MPDSQLPEIIQISLDDHGHELLQLNLIPKGSFLMGSRGNFTWEEPVHLVEILNDFYLAIYPVTQKQFAVWTRQVGVDHVNQFPGNHSHPAERMNRIEAKHYCNWLTDRFEQQFSASVEFPSAAWKIQLPTEAEWEYACSAWQDMGASTDPDCRSYTDYHTGDGPGALDMAGWFGENSDRKTRSVGRKQANRHGLFDMHGNVWEWCEDVWDSHKYCYRAQSFIGSHEEEQNEDDESAWRVLRGGSWRNHATGCRAAYRGSDRPDVRFGFIGFRVGLFPVRSS